MDGMLTWRFAYAVLALAVLLPQLSLRAPVAQAATNRYVVHLPEVGSRPSIPVASAGAVGARELLFGVYPGGGTGETPSYVKPTDGAVSARLKELAGGRPFVIHLYTAWAWHGDWVDAEVDRYSAAGFNVVLTVKYAPPAGHEGDVAGYEKFVRSIVRRYGAKPNIAFCIGNEANQDGNPEASDGAYPGAREAVARGVVAASDELTRMGSSAKVGFNFVIRNPGDDARFLQELTQLGGPAFAPSVDVVGVQVYPGIWYPGGEPYDDMVAALESARRSVDGVSGLRGRPLEVLETGAPLIDEREQASRLDALVRATLDNHHRLNVVHFNWFDLWDADSASDFQFAHYGLLRSDLTEKPAFARYRSFVAGQA
jgi:hypothetical protein